MTLLARSKHKVWMDAALFESWFHENFIPYVKKFDNQGIEQSALAT